MTIDELVEAVEAYKRRRGIDSMIAENMALLTSFKSDHLDSVDPLSAKRRVSKKVNAKVLAYLRHQGV